MRKFQLGVIVAVGMGMERLCPTRDGFDELVEFLWGPDCHKYQGIVVLDAVIDHLEQCFPELLNRELRVSASGLHEEIKGLPAKARGARCDAWLREHVPDWEEEREVPAMTGRRW